MLRPLLTLGTCLVLSFNAAAARLLVPEHFRVDTINGLEVRGGLLQRGSEHPLPAGPVVVELHYTDMQPAELGDSHSNFSSAPVAVRFVAVPDQDYRVQAERPTSERAATLFARAPRLTVVDAAGNPVAQQFLDAAALKQARLQPVAVAPAPLAAPAAAPAPAAPGPAAAAGSTLAADNLWFWWLQADAATREAFLRRIGRQAD